MRDFLSLDRHSPITATPEAEVRSEKSPWVTISFAADGRLRARTVVSRSRARPTGKFPSWKMKRMLQWESPHELNALRLLDCDPQVLVFREQPAELTYEIDGTQRKHFPDIYVSYADRDEFWEVKADPKSIDSETAARTKLLTDALRQRGYRYRLIFGNDLASQPRLENSLLLLRFGREEVSLTERERIRQAFHEPHTWGDIALGTFGPRGRQAISRLTLEGQISVSLDQPLTPETQITWISSAVVAGR